LENYTGPIVQTGAISGQGLSGAFAQQLANGQPLNSFYIGRFTGLDKDGIAEYEGDPNLNRFFVGSGNPKTLVGITANVAWKKLTLNMNLNGAFGHFIYNNTTQATLAVGNIGNNRNIAVSLYNPEALEAKGNAQPVSTRYLEKGDYLKMANATLSYGIGNISSYIKGANVFITGQNLFIITKYTGFDPEINTPRSIDNVPSFGIEYTPYPTARTLTLGVNFSL
jgi:iron complex outermembrane receptor protein